ncbi:MAG TPA: hypothetical protein VGC41_18905 [Kofleriaceae bacterium]
MKGLLIAGMFVGCAASPPAPDEPRVYAFGPFEIPADTEVSDQCLQITLGNPDAIAVNTVELVTGPGFHHSNWFWVPEVGPFEGPDGEFTCADRGFDQAVAALRGGVLFAQSTQSTTTVQQFPPGAVVTIPAHARLVAQLHLLNASDQTLHLTPTITLKPIAPEAITTKLAGVSFEDHALGLPPGQRSSFTVDCDLQPAWNELVSQGATASPTPDFHLYYALAHYHALGTGMQIDALAADDTAASTVFETTAQIGDALGGTIEPPFAMTGYSHLRFTCDYFNSTAATVGWGIGDQEMCVFLAFSDSPYNWAGGALFDNDPGAATPNGNVMTFTHACQTYAIGAN